MFILSLPKPNQVIFWSMHLFNLFCFRIPSDQIAHLCDGLTIFQNDTSGNHVGLRPTYHNSCYVDDRAIGRLPNTQAVYVPSPLRCLLWGTLICQSFKFHLRVLRHSLIEFRRFRVRGMRLTKNVHLCRAEIPGCLRGLHHCSLGSQYLGYSPPSPFQNVIRSLQNTSKLFPVRAKKLQPADISR